ncbi:MAG: bifunctional adenosylcobinamide kinase/adenosylcobinamide-phosphate guanylyltransferase [Mycobacterium sp.]
MRTLVLGGIRSGKSRWAEEAIAEAAADLPVRYLATGLSPSDNDGDPAWSARVAAHQLRRPPHWSTAESPDVATELRAGPDVATLVDDVGNWLTAAMDRQNVWGGGSISEEVDELMEAVRTFESPLVLVSPEVGLTVVSATEAGRMFTDALGSLNQRLAGACDRVVLVVAGQALTIKPQRR